MRVISEKMLREFWAIHPDAETPLKAWYRTAKKAKWTKFADIREAFPHADPVGVFTVFNIGGNKYRLIVVVHFNRGRIFVRHVLTHKEYSLDKWKDASPPAARPKRTKKPKDKRG
jgi:mRNA interferase HigB